MDKINATYNMDKINPTYNMNKINPTYNMDNPRRFKEYALLLDNYTVTSMNSIDACNTSSSRDYATQSLIYPH